MLESCLLRNDGLFVAASFSFRKTSQFVCVGLETLFGFKFMRLPRFARNDGAIENSKFQKKQIPKLGFDHEIAVLRAFARNESFIPREG